MSHGESLYLALVLTAFAVFMVAVGFISVWSRRTPEPHRTTANPTSSDHYFPRARFG